MIDCKTTETIWWKIINHEYDILESELEDYAVYGRNIPYEIYEEVLIISAKEELLQDYGYRIGFWDWLYDYAVSTGKEDAYNAFVKIMWSWLLAWVTGNRKIAPEFVRRLEEVRDGIKELLHYYPFEFIKEAYSYWRAYYGCK